MVVASFPELHAALTAPDQPFEILTEAICDIPTRIWKQAAPSLPAILLASQAHAGRTFTVYDDERTSFGEHFRQAAALARRLIENYGVRKGDRVAIAMRNFPEWSVAFWGASAAGAVVVPLNSWGTGAELAFARQALDITGRNIGLLRQLATTAESRYRVGTGRQQDVLRAQVELTVLIQESLRREQAIANAEAALAALLDLPLGMELPPIAGTSLSATAPELMPLLEGLEERSARLRATRARIEEARARARAAKLEGLPDVDLGLGYRIREEFRGDPVSGEDFFSAKITLRLPVYRSKWKARLAEERALLRGAEADHRAERAALVALTRRAHAELQRSTSEEALLETGLVPQAQQSLDSNRSAYEVGQIDFLSLLDSQVRLLDAELRLARTRADKRLAFATLEAAAGEKLR
jgi:hypothetical protein